MSTFVKPLPRLRRLKGSAHAVRFVGQRWVGVGFLVVSLSSVVSCSSQNDRVPVVRLVQVTMSGCTSQEVATGFIARPGVVVTAAHALRDVTVVSVDGKPATVMSVDERMDAALLRIDDSPQRFVEFADPVPSANVDVLRWQQSRTQRISATITTVASIEYSDLRLKTTSLRQGFLLDQESRAGDSGSPVLDDTGRIVGMLFASRSDGQVQGFAVAASELQALLAAPPTVPVWVGICT
jgi:S1-C subfamily serine protease